eukprot:TRINITY_DN3552_c0_g2_i1.p1 TRINITY_DN3552_c0_g2~~TRINITY_DN3552_c0_g2_i1.p1  ORF type:complete len:276 (+),score=64.49 TRINITY_DN3552_c0_g2_i1:58-828(+)
MPSKIQILSDVASGLCVLSYGEDVVHGNIHAGNIFANETGGTIKIANFGVTYPQHIHLVPPSTLRGKTKDVWGMGFLIWQVLSGDVGSEHYYNRQDLGKLTSGALLSRDEVDAVVLHPDAPAAMVQIMRDCFEPQVSLRPSIRSIATRIKSYLEQIIAEEEEERGGGDSSSSSSVSLQSSFYRRSPASSLSSSSSSSSSSSGHLRHHRQYGDMKMHRMTEDDPRAEALPLLAHDHHVYDDTIREYDDVIYGTVVIK